MDGKGKGSDGDEEGEADAGVGSELVVHGVREAVFSLEVVGDVCVEG